LKLMNKENMSAVPGANDVRLGALLREARVSPALPPRFQESVWRRIEEAEAPAPAAAHATWLEVLAALVLRPRFALAMAVALIAGGALFGVREGSQIAKQDAQARYLAVVAPNSLR
jgi:hypothetical protein